MELNSFIENFAAQFDETDANVFTADTQFRDIEEWSSLVGLSIIAMVDEEYDVTLKGDMLRKCNTVGELFEMVKSLQ